MILVKSFKKQKFKKEKKIIIINHVESEIESNVDIDKKKKKRKKNEINKLKKNSSLYQ